MNDSFNQFCALKNDATRAKRQWRTMKPMRSDRAYIWQDGTRYINFASNDYLGIAATLRSREGLAVGAGASRLVSGTHALHEQVESTLGQMKGTDAALLFGSGYLANIGVVPALVGAGDVVLMDKFSHACMIDGVQLSGAAMHRFRHNELAHLERLLQKHRGGSRNCLIMTETVFSMDGDCAPLAELAALAEQYDAWLMTDDAHGFGVVTQHNPAHVQMGTLSKAAGCYGGYVCGSHALIDMLKNYARSVMFSTALPEVMLQGIADALALMQIEPERADKVMENARYLCEALELPPPQSAIVPIIMGENDEALHAHQHLKQHGIFAPAIRPPTVPQGTARLRVCVSALHERKHLDALVKVLYTLL